MNRRNMRPLAQVVRLLLLNQLLLLGPTRWAPETGSAPARFATGEQWLATAPTPAISSNGRLAAPTGWQMGAGGLAHAADTGQAPRLIPLAALDRYQEGSDLRLFCSAASGTPKVTFEWRRNQLELLGSSPAGHEQVASSVDDLVSANRQRHVLISMMDDSSSVLRIRRLEAGDAGNYTCLARNLHGSDSSSVRITVNVRLKWIKEPPAELQVRAGKSVQVECDATGQPAPLLSWTSLKEHLTMASKVLRIDRAQVNDSGLYECRAYNPAAPHSDQLSKLLRLTVNAPATFDQKFVVIQAKLGDNVRLECNASGDQPLAIDWFREAHGGSTSSAANGSLIEKHGDQHYDIHESRPTEFGLSSAMHIRAVAALDGHSLYKCLAKNDFGTSERLIKLIVLGIPERPKQVRLRDVWSRSALVTWQAQGSSSSGLADGQASARINNYTVQYWRKSSLGPQPGGSLQNHRREEIQVDGLQNSALLANLVPALTYEVSVIANNLVGSSEPSESINITTSEEEPSAPPTDVQVEARGSSTLRVMWKTPPLESLNGKLLGFYIGYRSRALSGLLMGSSSPLMSLQSAIQPSSQPVSQQQQQQHSLMFSFKTADAVAENQLHHETFLTNLKPNQEYEVIVRAFNKAGSGPDCHTVLARTNSAKLPQAPSLQVQRVTANAVTLSWRSTVVLGAGGPRLAPTALQRAGLDILHFKLYYQLQGEADWYELAVARPPTATGQSAGELDTQELLAGEVSLPASAKPIVELVDGTNELITSLLSVHTLANLQSAALYRIYVAAVNDFGVGDPSNVVLVRTEPGSSLMASSGGQQLGQARVESPAAASSVSGLLDQWAQQPHGLLYSVLSSLALGAIVVILLGYLVWQRKLRRKYNSSSGSSYPSSWTPAATDTFQSEYSVKRFAGAGQSRSGQQLEPFGQPPTGAGSAPFMANSESAGRQLQHQLVRGGTSARPVLSSHYHQPADLISAGSGTLQAPRASQMALRQQQQSKAISTLNRNQNRQLPPIPYSTLSVKEIGGAPGKVAQQQQHWSRQQQQSVQAADYRLCSQQQQQQQHQQSSMSSGFRTNNKSVGGSQTPLIYGVIE